MLLDEVWQLGSAHHEVSPALVVDVVVHRSSNLVESGALNNHHIVVSHVPASLYGHGCYVGNHDIVVLRTSYLSYDS